MGGGRFREDNAKMSMSRLPPMGCPWALFGIEPEWFGVIKGILERLALQNAKSGPAARRAVEVRCFYRYISTCGTSMLSIE